MLEGKSFQADRVYVSPLRRCRETAEILFPGQSVQVVEDFRETDFGAFEGHTYEELKDDPAYRNWLATNGAAAPPGGESKESQQRRTVSAFLAVSQNWGEDETAALVVHGGTIMALLEALEPSCQFFRWQAESGGGYRCQWDGNSLVVVDRI
jgi:alpha-ribazole phosphatase